MDIFTPHNREAHNINIILCFYSKSKMYGIQSIIKKYHSAPGPAGVPGAI